MLCATEAVEREEGKAEGADRDLVEAGIIGLTKMVRVAFSCSWRRADDVLTKKEAGPRGMEGI